MNKSAVDLIINLSDVLTPASFSTILVQLIKYIAYNSKSIPYTYEGFSHLVKRRRYLISKNDSEEETSTSFNDIIANNFFLQVSEAYDNYEATFLNLWEELKNPDRVKQIVFLLGNTLVNPRCSYRIRKPYLSIDNCENAVPVRKPLVAILKSLLNSAHLNTLFESFQEPSNLFILIELSSGHNPKTEWFLPLDNFSLSTIKKEINIVLDSPSVSVNSSENSNCIEELISQNSEDVEFCSNWHRSKEVIKGFKDKKIGGKSIFNYLLES